MSDYQNIPQRQLDGAKVYTNRWNWIQSLPKGLDIAEVGVGSGDYSSYMIKTISPNSLTLIDLYNQSDPMFARPGEKLRFSEEDHYDFIKNRFIKYNNVRVIKGNSLSVLPKLIIDQEKFDMIYIDASHEYGSVYKDIWNASLLLRDNGILAINDYVYYVEHEEYGVISATNEFLHKNPDWHVIGFALEEKMMSDIYLSKHPQ